MWFGFESEVRGFMKQKYILVFKERKYSYRHFVKHKNTMHHISDLLFLLKLIMR